MPVYRYQCPECGEFEALQGIKEDPLGVCSCGQPVKRLIPESVGFVIPAYMSATRDTASQRQAEYLKSDRHRKRAAESEAYQERIYQANERLERGKKELANEIRERVAEDSRYVDQSPQAVMDRVKKHDAKRSA